MAQKAANWLELALDDARARERKIPEQLDEMANERRLCLRRRHSRPMLMMTEMKLVISNNVELMLALIMMIQDCLIKANSSCPQHITHSNRRPSGRTQSGARKHWLSIWFARLIMSFAAWSSSGAS